MHIIKKYIDEFTSKIYKDTSTKIAASALNNGSSVSKKKKPKIKYIISL